MVHTLPPYVGNIREDRSEALELIRRAHEAESAGQYKEAYNLHTRGANLLIRTIAYGTKKSEQRRLDKLCLRASKERRDVLRGAAEGGAPPLVSPLPSAVTALLELANQPPGRVFLSLVECKVWESLMNLSTSQDLEFDNHNHPYLTPMLSKDIPNVIFHIYDQWIVRRDGVHCHLHVKASTKSQILYTLHTFKPSQQPIGACTLSRATEYHDICNRVYVGSVEQGDLPIFVRPLTITTGLGTTRTDMPDRRKPRSPHRFTYGNRRFVWKRLKGMSLTETLYEVKLEWPMLGSRTGKVDDQTFERPIAWIRPKSGLGKVAIVGMVGGLDQLFQEFILASVLSKQMVERHPHAGPLGA